jgi:putative DNA primase/helicase
MSILEAKSASNVSHLNLLPSIADVYEAIKGEPLEGDGDERRGYCLNTRHPDASPSCDYNVVKDTFHCKVCDAAGKSIALAIVAGLATDNASAKKWFRDHGLMIDTTEANRWVSVSCTYQYRDAAGKIVYEVGRWNLGHGKKAFGQRVPDGDGGWNAKSGCLNGVTRVPYMLPELIAHIAAGSPGPVFVVEGEKDATNLQHAGAVATTNAQGAKWRWPVSWAEHFRGVTTVYVLADNDEAGRDAARQRAALIATVVPNVHLVLSLPGVGDKGDVSDWLAANENDLASLATICDAAPLAEPYKPAYDPAAVPAVVSDLSDIGAARWFSHHYKEAARFIKEAKGWYVYRDGIWEHDSIRAAALAEEAVDGLGAAAADYNGDRQDDFADFAIGARALSRRKNMLESAQPHLLERIAIFDRHPDLLNCANGTVDLGTGSLRPYSPGDFLTIKTPVDYDPAAKCPMFVDWLRSCVTDAKGVVDEDLFEYMQMVMGSCLEGKPGLRAFYFIVGPKGTGKSTFVRVLKELLGPYQCATDFNALTESKFGSDGGAPSPHLAMLRGKRLVSAAEAKSNRRLDAARVKQLIGGDTITARFLNQDPFEFEFEATLLMTGNEVPRIEGDESIWSKFKPVPFDHPIASEDPDFVENVLVPELPGILNFAIEGLRKLKAAKYRIVDPPAVVAKRDAEFAEQDTFAAFIDECILRATPAEIGSWTAIENSAVREAFVQWCKRQSQPGLAPKAFIAAMRRHGIEEGVRHGQRTWKNIRLKAPDDRSPMPAGYNDL